jgi:hypothetical protein
MEGLEVHEFRRFIEAEMDIRGWDRPRLQAETGLSRAHVHKLLTDKRESLGRMPDEKTLQGLAKPFGYEKVRTAAARSLARYSDDGSSLKTELTAVATDALLKEIRRRINAAASARPGVIDHTELYPPASPDWTPDDLGEPPSMGDDEQGRESN